MKRKLEILILVIALACVSHAQTPSQLFVNSTLKFYGGNCTTNLHCTSNYCLNNTCACTDSSDCVYGGYCSAGTCYNNASIYTEFDTYSRNTTMTIIGNNYYPNSVALLKIINYSGSVVSGFPINVNVNSTGSFMHDYLVTAPNGSYTIIGEGILRYTDYANKTVDIASPYKFYGRIIDPFNGTVPSNIFVYYNGILIAVDDEVYELTFDYGKKYDIIIKPDISSIKQLLIHWIANEGHVGDIMGFDEAPVTGNFSKIIVFHPLLTNYEDIILTVITVKNVNMYKCADWNFTGRICNNNWILFGTYANTEINLTLTPGDPGIGIEKITGKKKEEKGEEGAGGGGGGGSVGGIMKLDSMPEALLAKTCLGINQSYLFYIKRVKYSAKLVFLTGELSTLKINDNIYSFKLNHTQEIDIDDNGIIDTKIYFEEIKSGKACYDFYEVREGKESAENITIMGLVFEEGRLVVEKLGPNYLIWILIILLLIILLIILIYIRRRRRKETPREDLPTQPYLPEEPED